MSVSKAEPSTAANQKQMQNPSPCQPDWPLDRLSSLFASGILPSHARELRKAWEAESTKDSANLGVWWTRDDRRVSLLNFTGTGSVFMLNVRFVCLFPYVLQKRKLWTKMSNWVWQTCCHFLRRRSDPYWNRADGWTWTATSQPGAVWANIVDGGFFSAQMAAWRQIVQMMPRAYVSLVNVELFIDAREQRHRNQRFYLSASHRHTSRDEMRKSTTIHITAVITTEGLQFIFDTCLTRVSPPADRACSLI